MSAQKRKRTNFTLKDKKEIIDAVKEPNHSKLAREFNKKWGVELKRTTMKGILTKNVIEAAIQAGVPSIKEKAMKLADLMHIPYFMASDDWLDNFKKRHGITFKTVQGEAGAVDSQVRCDRPDNEIRRKKMRQPTILRALD